MITVLEAQQARTLYGVSYDVIFSTVTTLAIFALGYVFNRFYDNNKHRRDLWDIRAFVLPYLESLIEPIAKQVSYFNDLSDDIASKSHQDFVFQEVVGVKLDVLDELSQVDLFNSFLLGAKKTRDKRLTQFKYTLDALEFVKRQRDIARSQFLDFVASLNRYQESWNKSTNAILRLHDEFLSAAKRSGSTATADPFMKGFNLLVHDWTQLDDRTSMDTVAQHLLEPLKQLCKDHSPDVRTNAVLPLILEVLYVLQNRNHLLTLYAGFFKEQASGLGAKKDALSVAIKSLK